MNQLAFIICFNIQTGMWTTSLDLTRTSMNVDKKQLFETSDSTKDVKSETINTDEDAIK